LKTRAGVGTIHGGATVSTTDAVHKWVEPRMLRWARTRLHLAVQDVEARSAHLPGGSDSYRTVSAGTLAAWEDGRLSPCMAELETLATIYDCPVGYFFLDEPPAESQELSFRGLDRTKSDQLSPVTLASIERFKFLAAWFGNLLEDLGVDWPVTVGSAHPSDPPAEVARRERARLGFSPEVRGSWTNASEAFHWWRYAVERLGVFVFELKLNPDDARGAALWAPGTPPCILVNRYDAESAAGREFSLLHEYVHLTMTRHGYVCDMRGTGEDAELETFANEVAAKMLVQDDDLDAVLQSIGLDSLDVGKRYRWTDAEIDRLRLPLCVSRDVVAILLERRNLAPAGFYRQQRSRWESRPRGVGWARGGTTRSQRVLREIGYSGSRLLSSESASSLAPLDVAELLNVKVEHLDQVLAELRQGSRQT
jgi:Zn-dependent peptidase ImmA (M78 family)